MIKFRAWHKQEKQMYPVCGLEWSCDDDGSNYQISRISIDVHGGFYFFEDDLLGELVLMQWTGFYDVGLEKEIYENDIMQTDYSDDTPNHCGVVEQLRSGAWIVNFGCTFTFLYDPDMNLMLVGNIYENSDLLNKD